MALRDSSLWRTSHEVRGHDPELERPPHRGVTRFRYGTQVGAGPPSFVLFGGKVPDAGYRRFLENRFRRAFDLEGIPVRIRFRARKGARLPSTGGKPSR